MEPFRIPFFNLIGRGVLYVGYAEHYNLHLPTRQDSANIDVLNENTEIIAEHLYKLYRDKVNKLMSEDPPYETSGSEENKYLLTDPPITELTEGMTITIIPHEDSTGPSTLNWCETGDIPIKNPDGTDPILKAGTKYKLRYDGQHYVIVSVDGGYLTGGSNSQYTVNNEPPLEELEDDKEIVIIPNHDSNGPTTLDVDGTGAKPVVDPEGNDPNLKAGERYRLRYDKENDRWVVEGIDTGLDDSKFNVVIVGPDGNPLSSNITLEEVLLKWAKILNLEEFTQEIFRHILNLYEIKVDKLGAQAPGIPVENDGNNNYTSTEPPTSIANGETIIIIPDKDSTGPSTLDVDGNGPKPIKNPNGSDPILKKNVRYILKYNEGSNTWIVEGIDGAIPTEGSNNNYIIAVPEISKLEDGSEVIIKPHQDSDGPATLNWSGTGPKPIKNKDGTPAELKKDYWYTLKYSQADDCYYVTEVTDGQGYPNSKMFIVVVGPDGNPTASQITLEELMHIKETQDMIYEYFQTNIGIVFSTWGDYRRNMTWIEAKEYTWAELGRGVNESNKIYQIILKQREDIDKLINDPITNLHIFDPKPHHFTDSVTGKIYKYGLKAANGVVSFVYDEHIHEDDIVYTDPTCTANAYTTYRCVQCLQVRVIDHTGTILGHNYKSVVTVATCTTGGYTTHTCARCSNTYQDGVIAALGHDYKSVVTSPTCTENGFTTYTCNRCKHTYEANAVAKLGHNEDSGTITVPATCTLTGIRTYKCTRCAIVMRTASIPATGHTEDAGTITTAATCTATGVKTFKCTKCSVQLRTEAIPALGHIEDGGTITVPPTCTAYGNKVFKCTRCSVQLRAESVPALGHDYTSVVTHPTCTTDGYTTYTCTRCSDRYTGNVVNQWGHNEGPEYIITKPTIVDGSKGRKCGICNNVRVTETIPAIAIGAVLDITDDYKFITSSGDIYVSASTAGYGLKRFDTTTKTLTPVTGLSGQSWNKYFESSKGNVYVSSSNSVGLYRLNGNTATQVISTGQNWQFFFEDSSGNVYTSSSENDESGIYHLNGTIATQVLANGRRYYYFFEDSKGNIYVSHAIHTGSANYFGIYHLRGTSAATHIVADYSYGWGTFFEDSKGNVYIAGGDHVGIYHLNGKVATKILNKDYFWEYFFEDSKGNVYVSTGDQFSKQSGLYHLNGTAATQILSTGYGYKYFFEDSKGNVYASGGSNTNTGELYHLNGKVVTHIGTAHWVRFFEDSRGNVYASGGLSSIGIYHLNGKVVTQIGTGGWQYFFEDSKKNVYVGSYNTDSSNLGIYHLDGVNTPTQILTTGYWWEYFFEDSNGNVYVSRSGGTNGIYLLNGTATATQVYASGSNWQYWQEKNNQVTVSAPANTGELVWNSTTQKFTLNSEVESTYNGTPFGVFTWNNPVSGTTRIWYDRVLIMTDPTKFIRTMTKNKVSLIIDNTTNPTKLLIIIKK